MLARLAAFILWALVSGCVVYWSLKLLVRAPAAPAHSVAAVVGASVRGDLTRLLGAAPVASVAPTVVSAAASRFRLHGVMAPKMAGAAKPSAQGVALISVDGKSPRAYAVGARIDSNLVLQSVSMRSAAIGPADGPASVKIEVPALPPPSVGKLSTLGALPAVTSEMPPAGASPPASPTLPASIAPYTEPRPVRLAPAGVPALPPGRDPALSR
jgi:general secretion pathway protein C